MQTACVIVAEWDVNMKKNGIKKGTMRIAVCGIIAALSLVFMMMTSLVPIGTYALPCLAGILISCIVVEQGISHLMMRYGNVFFQKPIHF